jgi:transcriptional regulator with PAS, ATPase and Fis domain
VLNKKKKVYMNMNNEKHAPQTWLMDFCKNNTQRSEKVLNLLTKKEVFLHKWEAGNHAYYGLVLMDSISQFAMVLSFLSIHVINTSQRIIVLYMGDDEPALQEITALFQNGAEYFYTWQRVAGELTCIADKFMRWRIIDHLIDSPRVKQIIVGESNTLRKVLRSIAEAASYSSSSILVMGERGTGKELAAKLVHELDARQTKHNLVVVDCTTIKPDLSGSEFFGHEKGSYTGADTSRDGAFSMAHGGTLFLDEIGELPFRLQGELLRVIQEGVYKKLGSNTWKQSQFRLISATNRVLEEECVQGRFRSDLYDRISTLCFRMPPLRERKEDIPAIINHYLLKKYGAAIIPLIEPCVYEYLQQHDYAGNIRELVQIVHKIMLRYTGKGPITIGDIADIRPVPAAPVCHENWQQQAGITNSIRAALEEGADLDHIEETVRDIATHIAFAMTGNNKQVSAILGKSERWVQLQRAKGKVE